MNNIISFVKYFRIQLIITAVLLCIFTLLYNFHGSVPENEKGRRKDNSTTSQRVFDYADKLTDRQEEKLQKLIEKRIEQSGVDIVLVTLNEDLKKWYSKNLDTIEEHHYDNDYYQQNINDDIKYLEICIWANVFYDTHKFGYDGYDDDKYYSGKGVLFVDNWYNEQTWLCTTGDIIETYEKYDAAKSWHILDLVGDMVEFSPYLAYKIYVDTIYFDQVGIIPFTSYVYWQLIILAGIVWAIIFYFVKSAQNFGANTTVTSTYFQHNPVINRAEDIFVNKYVTSHVIQSSSSGHHGGGHHGGGHHGGGHSHGGHGGGH